jgi:hypothetical protein
MEIYRKWAMPNRWTFTIKPIKELLEDYVREGVWVDPFAGKNSPASLTNDINPERDTDYNMDALSFLRGLSSDSYDGVLYDPPYSIRQAKECYDSYGVTALEIKPNQMNYWSECKTEISRILKKDGIVISFGWNSMGIGKTRGFEKIKILLVPHGGSRNDTICTVERKK